VLAVVGELDASDEFRVSEHGGHALSRVVVVDGDSLVGARGGCVDAAAVQGHLDQRTVVAVGTLERPAAKMTFKHVWLSLKLISVPGVLPVADGVDPDVPVLTCGEHVFAVGVHLHVVKGRLPDHVVTPAELWQSSLVGRDLPDYDGFVCAAADHLRVRRRVEPGQQEADGRDGRTVVIERRQKVVVPAHVEDVDEAVAARRDEEAAKQRKR
jgi:hypothetical protein